MKKLFRSPWLMAVLAIVLGLGAQAVALLRHADELVAPPAEVAFDTTRPPDRIEWKFDAAEFEALRSELKDRLATVAKREEELKAYETRLKAERAEIEKLKREIETVRQELSTRLIEIDAGEQKNLKTLATTYSNLSPAAALAIFKEMDDDMVVKILAFMKPDVVGPIFEVMAQTKDGDGTLAERAAALSNKLRLMRQARAGENS